MAINILLGIGGTGAKIVESALFLLSAGVGPKEKVIVGLVDQDNSNGNVVRTLRLLEMLLRLRDDFGPGKSNRIDWDSSDAEGGTSLLSIEVEPLLIEKDQTHVIANQAHWRPAPGDGVTLQQILRDQTMSADEKALLNLLYRDDTAAPEELEQTMELNEGYRGRAHVGASALVAALHHDQPMFLERLKELMRLSATNEEVRIFIAGSLFGGTGAAGFPTIARSLNNLRAPENEDEISANHVRIGGGLMLPYFSFADPDSTKPKTNVIKAGQLLPQARVAIQYYERMMQQEQVFDRLYIAGWDELFKLEYHEAGRDSQRNPPLLPELVGALAALDFFTLDKVEREPEPLVCARPDNGAFGWNDLPARRELKEALYDRLGAALRFAVWWLYRAEPEIDNRTRSRPRWLERLQASTDWETDTPETRGHLIGYAKSLLEWAASMRLFGKERLEKFELWNPESLHARAELRNPADPIELQSSREEKFTTIDIDVILHAKDAQTPPKDGAKLFDELSVVNPSKKSTGLGRVVAGVHRAAYPSRK